MRRCGQPASFAPISTGGRMAYDVASRARFYNPANAGADAVNGDPRTADAATGRPPGGWSAYSIYALVLLSTIYTFNYLDRQILSLVAPLIQKDLHLSDAMLGVVAGLAFVLPYAVVGIAVAWLADRSNRRNIVAIGFAFWSLMTLLTGFVGSVWQLAVTRSLMGAGEASNLPPGNAMLADIFSPARRPLALSLLAVGSALAGIFLYPLIGWISQAHGWRAAYVTAGIPGLAVALLFYLTVKEPVRGHADGAAVGAAPEPSVSFFETVRYLAGSRAYLLLLVGGFFSATVLYGGSFWTPSFIVRVHHMTVAQVANLIGPIRGISGAVSIVLGGVVAARLGRVHERWRLLTPGIACILVGPAELVFLFGKALPVWLGGSLLSMFFLSMHVGPIYAACVSVARPRMRAMATALFMVSGSLVGQTLGPVLVGRLNDYLQPRYGALSIRYSMLVIAASAVIAGLCFVAASFFAKADVERMNAG
jgi:MFS family permease